ncbi:MAG: cupin [Balneola sp.]|jgi:mannose-6-phosphate isomerase-like protein (cupin superfamily)|nr:cupin [Balneola sp.]MBE80694.1 cupin [Balneola sp.]|tara:strand:- start:120 stop:569 length:450 start_codon:yes stop_codon:yes gene_type:complete
MSKVIKCENFEWQGVERKDYKSDTSCYQGVHRYSILGEGEHEQELNFQTRYFEVNAGGYTSLEYHRHPHTVVIIRGSGSMVLGDEIYELNIHDVVFISPETLHQFHADKEENLGFICIVDRYRDKPTLPDDDYIASEVRNPEVKEKLKR